jgi:O-antigen ligase
MHKILSNISFAFICLILVFTPLARGGVQGWAIAVMHIVTLLALAILLVQRSLEWDWHWIRTPLDWPIAALLLLTFFSTVFSSHRPTSVWAFLLLLNYVIIYYLVIHTVHSRGKLRGLLWVILGTGGFLAIFGLIKFSGLNIFPWFYYDDLPYFGALTSTYGNPNNIAGFFEMTIPLALGLLLADRRGRRSQIMYLPMLLLFGIALILTLSRGGWTCAMLGLLFFLSMLLFSEEFPRRRMAIILTCSSIVAVLVLLSSFPAVQELLTVRQVVDQAGGVDIRLQVTKAVAAMTMDRPLLGFGPGTFAYSFLQYQPPGIQGWYTLAHNDYVHFIAETGILLAAIMVWMIIALFWHGFKKLHSPSLFIRGATLGSMAGIFAILCHSVIDFNLHIPANALLFTVFTAIVAAPEFRIKKFRMGKVVGEE